MVTLRKLDNKNLVIELTDKDELIEIRSKTADDRERLADILEVSRYNGNGWKCEFNIGLTECPAITYGAEIDDDGESIIRLDTDLWVFDSYMLECFTDTLLEQGKVIFKFVEGSN